MREIQFYEKRACKRCKKYLYPHASSTKIKIMLFVEDKSDLGESKQLKYQSKRELLKQALCFKSDHGEVTTA